MINGANKLRYPCSVKPLWVKLQLVGILPMTEENTNRGQVRKFHDGFGRELEAHKCEYCDRVMPVGVWTGIEHSTDTYHVLIAQVIGSNGQKIWLCNDCAIDIDDQAEK